MSKQQNDWRYRCPEGHCQWLPSDSGYFCRQCKENGDDPNFDTLRDMKREPLRY